MHEINSFVTFFLFVFIHAHSWLNSCCLKIPDSINPFALPHIQDH